MLLIALEGESAATLLHVAHYLRDKYGFIPLTHADLGAPHALVEGLKTYLEAFTASRKRTVTTHAEARNVGRLLNYKPNSRGKPGAVPLGFEYYEDHAGLVLMGPWNIALERMVRENEGCVWRIVEPSDEPHRVLTSLRTGDKLILHNSSPERLNTAVSMALGGEMIVNTIVEAANEVS